MIHFAPYIFMYAMLVGYEGSLYVVPSCISVLLFDGLSSNLFYVTTMVLNWLILICTSNFQ